MVFTAHPHSHLIIYILTVYYCIYLCLYFTCFTCALNHACAFQWLFQGYTILLILKHFFYLPALPQWVRMINDTQMDSGEKLRWECKAMGRPRPTYRWLRNGLPLTSQVPISP